VTLTYDLDLWSAQNRHNWTPHAQKAHQDHEASMSKSQDIDCATSEGTPSQKGPQMTLDGS